MIEKMKFMHITGPKRDFDRVIQVYLNRYDIHLENALSELGTVHNLKPFVEVNPYKELLSKSDDLIKLLGKEVPNTTSDKMPEEAAELLQASLTILDELNERKRELQLKKEHFNDLIRQIEPFRHLDYDMKKILNLRFIKFRFGKIAHEHFNRFSKYVYDNLNSLFHECDRDSEYVWGIYFVPAVYSVKIDAIYASMHFERIILPDEYEGTPEEAYQLIKAKRNEVNLEIHKLSQSIKQSLADNIDTILSAYHTLQIFSRNFEVRKQAACTKEKNKEEVFYILCGWITEKDAIRFQDEASCDPNIYVIIEEGQESVFAKPPTKLKNPGIFKPFEMFITMYGLPAYSEIDPTFFVAITYSILFGIMFGDVGQGLCLMIGGFLIYLIKKVKIAAIVSVAGIFSTFFGFMYGSIFGFEGILKPLWLTPMHNVMTVLFTAISFGACLILIAMMINIINGIKEKNYARVFFDTNGIAGLVFYGAAITCAAFVYLGKALPATILLVLFFGIPLLLIFLREPISHHLKRKSKLLPDNKGMFFIEATFELFEVLLSYITNTISFLRVGAFALSHAAMMGVVMLLARVEAGSPNIPVLILGNLLVAGMEGLIVGIQVLRLEYYEMFSRFYKGTGKEFKPYRSK